MNNYKTDKTEICHDWQENLIAFSKEHEFPAEAVELLSNSLELIIKNEHLYHVFTEWEQKYWENPDLDYVLLQKILEDFDGEEGISKYTFDLLFMIGISRRTWELYQKRGISREIFHDSMADMHWKLLECHQMYDIWGTFVMHWFPWWFQLKRFALGRLQFELIKFDDEYEKDGLILHKDSPVINLVENWITQKFKNPMKKLLSFIVQNLWSIRWCLYVNHGYCSRQIKKFYRNSPTFADFCQIMTCIVPEKTIMICGGFIMARSRMILKICQRIPDWSGHIKNGC